MTDENITTVEFTPDALVVIREEITTLTDRMLGRMLHFPADRCANCDVRRAVTLLERIIR